MSRQTKRSFSREFKLAAVIKPVEQGHSAGEVAADLDLNENLNL